MKKIWVDNLFLDLVTKENLVLVLEDYDALFNLKIKLNELGCTIWNNKTN